MEDYERVQKQIKFCSCGYEMFETRNCIKGTAFWTCTHCNTVRSYQEQLELAIVRVWNQDYPKDTI